MKVYIINFHHVLNYGAVLQAYALSKYLINQGYDAKIIDYRPYYFVYQTYKPAKGLKKTYRKMVMNINFYNFRKKHFNLTDRIFYSEKGLKNHFNKSKDAFVCGSDQVWNAKLTNDRLDPGYFLDFVPSSGRKIAYAASIGHTKFNLNNKKDITSRLVTFHKISVREDFAKNEVEDITDNKLKPEVVLDPTLILSDYSEVLDLTLVPNKPYLVVYTTENSNMFRKYVKLVQKSLGIQVINLGHYDIGIDSISYTNIHPTKWLGLFSMATYVCTNSFHGTAFSIILKRNFTVFGRQTMKDLNRRQLTLLSNIGLEDRFINKLEDFNPSNHLKEVEYEKIQSKIDSLVENSQKFLLDSLK